MKIDRFSINENAEAKRFHVFAIYNEDNPIEKGDQTDFELFDDEKDAFNFLSNKLYKIYKDYELDLKKLDKINDSVDLIEEYENEFNSRALEQKIFYTTITNKIEWTPAYYIHLSLRQKLIISWNFKRTWIQQSSNIMWIINIL